MWFSDYFIITKEYDPCYVGLLNNMFFFQFYAIEQLCCWSFMYIICTMHNTACLHDLTFEVLKIYQHVLSFYLNKLNLPTNHIQYMHTMWQDYWRLMSFLLNTWTSALHTQTHTHTRARKYVLAVWLTLNYLFVLHIFLEVLSDSFIYFPWEKICCLP